jgi:hypothetical protein
LEAVVVVKEVLVDSLISLAVVMEVDLVHPMSKFNLECLLRIYIRELTLRYN